MSEQQNGQQWLRKASWVVLPPRLNKGDADAQEQADYKGLELSGLRFTFQVEQGDTTSPNNAAIKVYNLSETTMKRIRGEFSRVMLKCGYENGAFGLIFDGDVMQYRLGKENATDSFFELLAADGDLGFNFGVVNQSFGAGVTSRDIMQKMIEQMGFKAGYLPDLEGTNPTFVRGKVGFGMARDMMTQATDSTGTTWSIQNGAVQVLPVRGYLPGAAVVVNALTGMIGIPEQTDQGVRFRTLLNPKLRIGGLVKLNNKDINQLVQQKLALPIPYNQWAGIQFASKLAEGADGLYRLYVVEHVGDSRGQAWYSDCICLAIDQSSKEVVAKN